MEVLAMRAWLQSLAFLFAVAGLGTQAFAEDAVPSPQDTQRVAKELQGEDPEMAGELKRLGKFYEERFRSAPEAARSELSALQRKATEQNWTFQPAYTAVFGRDIAKMTGMRIPANATALAKRQNEFAAEARKALRAAPAPLCDPAQRKFSLRKLNKVSPVVDQGQCGSCWAFTTVAAFESNYLVRGGKKPNASEQHILDCAVDPSDGTDAGNCDGGWYYPAFNWSMSTPIANRRQAPYRGAKDASCRIRGGQYLSLVWGFVDPDNWNDKWMAPDASLKQAMCEHGALAVAVNATDDWSYYGGGVYNIDADADINHAVTLVGWDDDLGAWLIKNSWSRDWGDGGYMWIKYGTSRIGTVPAWVEVQLGRPNAEFKEVTRRYKDIFGEGKAPGQ
jgi:cathepsin L